MVQNIPIYIQIHDKIKEDIEGLKMLLRAYRSGDFDV